MADKLNVVAGTPARRTIKGQEWEFHPLSLADLGEVEKWLEDRPVLRLMELISRHGGTLPPETKSRLLADALGAAAKVNIAEPEALEALKSLEGTTLFLWLSLRKGKPGLTREQVVALLQDEHMGSLRAMVEVISGLRAPPGGAPGESGPGAEAGG